MKARTLIGPKKKIAFVCSGGGTKAGAFHLGVALALQEQGFKFYGGLQPKQATARAPGPLEVSTYVGSSAGSIISTFLAAGYSLENIFNSFLGREPKDPRDAIPRVLPPLTYRTVFRLKTGLVKDQMRQLMEFHRLIRHAIKGEWDSLLEFKWFKSTGLFSTAGIEEFLRKEVLTSNSFSDYLPELFITATQLNHSRKVVFGKFHFEPPPEDPSCQYSNEIPISQACAASASLPFIYSPYKLSTPSGRTFHYIDGEIRDTLSTHVAVDAGCDLIIASYTHQPYHYIKSIGSLTKMGLPAIIVQSIYLVIEQKINNHIFNKKIQKNAINAVSQYCKQQGLSEDQRRRITEILENELHQKMNIDTIYIHPRHNDHSMFIKEHFSLLPKTLGDLVKIGFKAGVETLRNYDFADRQFESGPRITDVKAPSELV